MTKKGFTLIEVLIAISLLAVISLVSVAMVTNLVRSALKSQASIDIEQASSFVLLKMENDIEKAYYAEVTGGTSLTLQQGTPASPLYVVYAIVSGEGGLPNYITVKNNVGPVVKLTDDALDASGNVNPSSVSVDLASSGFSLVSDAAGKPMAVNIALKFVKPTTATSTKVTQAEYLLDTTIVLRGAN